MNCFESKNWENDGAGINGGESVTEGDDDHIFDTILGRIVVRPKADNWTKGKAKGVKHLSKKES